MRKIKIISLLITLLFTGSVFAQSVDEGKRFLYYERYNSAKDVLNRMVNANPNNIDAVYWLGQTYLAQDDSISAKALYQKTLTANPNARKPKCSSDVSSHGTNCFNGGAGTGSTQSF
jgi:tetratricopeptide (TPR) repeat protein